MEEWAFLLHKSWIGIIRQKKKIFYGCMGTCRFYWEFDSKKSGNGFFLLKMREWDFFLN